MKYRLTERIGSGGMAEVFRAVGSGPEGFERPFVIKRIHPRLSEAAEFVRMFVDEAKISARLIHPNIVTVFEFAYQDGGYYIVMEPVDGMDMGWLLRRRREGRHELLSPAFVAEVGRQACRGLDFAHTLADTDGTPLGIVHRDVTPPNIMVAWNGTVKVLDFGIARAAQAIRTNLTEAGMVKGKMSYVAPEMLEGKTADARSDVFSLGIVLHELLSGRQLFSGENDLETLKLVKEMPIPKPSTHNPGVKPALDGVVMRALERDPAERYQSAGEMGDELETLVLRKGYSTRALARKVRELAEQEGATSAGIGVLPAPITLGREDSSVVVNETNAPLIAPTPPTGRFGRAKGWAWLSVGVVCLFAIGILGAFVRRPNEATASNPPKPAPAPAPKPKPTTARVGLDSDPQGAAVSRGGRWLGQTPLVLELPIGETAVVLTLTKAEFHPLVYKVVPHQDKDVVAKLERMGRIRRSPR